MIMETRIEEDIVNSDVFIYDCTNLTLGHILRYTLPVLKKIDAILVCKNTLFSILYIIYIWQKLIFIIQSIIESIRYKN